MKIFPFSFKEFLFNLILALIILSLTGCFKHSVIVTSNAKTELEKDIVEQATDALAFAEFKNYWEPKPVKIYFQPISFSNKSVKGLVVKPESNNGDIAIIFDKASVETMFAHMWKCVAIHEAAHVVLLDDHRDHGIPFQWMNRKLGGCD